MSHFSVFVLKWCFTFTPDTIQSSMKVIRFIILIYHFIDLPLGSNAFYDMAYRTLMSKSSKSKVTETKQEIGIVL
jgi:hypothetical protein